jgi:hypothetical protein
MESKNEVKSEEKKKLIHPKDNFEKNVAAKYQRMIDAYEAYIKITERYLLDHPLDKAEPSDAVELSYLAIKLLKAKDELSGTKNFYQLRCDEFNGGYLPKFEEQLKACNENFDKYYERAKNICKYIKPNYFTEGVNNYPSRNPDSLDLQLKVTFFKFLFDNVTEMERLAKKNPDYR